MALPQRDSEHPQRMAHARAGALNHAPTIRSGYFNYRD
jgi:hypothetical protein